MATSKETLLFHTLGTLYYTSTGGTGPIFMSHVSCSGFESRLLDCSYTITLSSSHSNDISVRCSPGKKKSVKRYLCLIEVQYSCLPVSCSDGDIRLVGGGTEREGRVEVCLDQRWGTVNGDGWSAPDSQVVCRQLGYLTASNNVFLVSVVTHNLD